MSARITHESSRYYVVVAGARCAGAATALLLARKGLRVLGGADDVVYLWIPTKNAPVPAPGCQGAKNGKIALGDLEPPIEGRFLVTLADGSEVGVAPVGSLLREQLAPWTFETAAAVTGLAVETIRDFAEGFAAAKRPMILSSWGSNRYLHSDLINRTKILCLSLKGAIGGRGAGYHSTGWVGIDGFGRVANESGGGFWGTVRATARVFGDAYITQLDDVIHLEGIPSEFFGEVEGEKQV